MSFTILNKWVSFIQNKSIQRLKEFVKLKRKWYTTIISLLIGNAMKMKGYCIYGDRH